VHRRSLWLRLKALIAPTRAESELHEELEFHLAMQARKYESAGVDPDEAIRRARLEFGNLELVKEDARDVRGIRPLEELVQDVRYALRGLRRAPGFTLSVILTIGLGLGISTSAFTIFNAYVLRPFDVRDPYSLYSVQWQDRAGHIHDFAATNIEAIRGRHSAFSDAAVYRTVSARLKGVAAIGDGVSENYFNMLGVRPAIGRTLVADDRGTAVVVLSYSAWRTRFGGDSSVVGRLTLLHGYPFTIVGVAREGFAGLFKKPRDFWVPITSLDRFEPGAETRATANESLSSIARLAPGVSEGQGRAFVASQLETLTASLPDGARFARAFLTSRASAIPRSLTSYLAFAPLVLAFGLVLVLACANVANMLLARGLARQRELGVRLALGAARARLLRQLVTESVVLAVPAVALGFGIAWLTVDVGVRTLFMTLPSDLAAFVRLVPLEPDPRVALFAFAAAVGSAFLFGLMPALQTTRISIVQATRGMFALESSPGRLRNVLIVGQIVVSSLLLTVAAILLREAARLGRTETGLRTRDVVSIEVEDKARAAVLASLRANRVVDTIAAAASLPLDMRFATVSVATGADSAVIDLSYNRVSRSYFDILGISLTSGRGFSAQDESRADLTVVVSEAAARRLWPNGSPLGQLLRVKMRDGSSDSQGHFQSARVIGTAKDVVVNSVEMGKSQPVVYFPAAPEEGGCCLLVRVKGEPELAKRALDADLERDAPGGVDRIDRLETFVIGAVYPYRAAYWVALSLGLIALGLTAVGVYGVVSYVASQRAREIGIRIALGATTADVVELVLRQTVRHAAVGIALGTVFAVGAARVIASNVQGMPTFDIVALVGGAVCVFLACMCAAVLPSRRVATTDPSAALREE
jgi:predicted permease